MKPRIPVQFYSAFIFLLEFTKTSSMVEKTLNKSLQTSYTSNDLVYLQVKSQNKHSSTPCLKDKEFPWVVFDGKTQHLPYDS